MQDGFINLDLKLEILQAASSKKWRSSESYDSSQNGTSWAFEYGTGYQACPIVVEDLENPGHMLIEVFSLILLALFFFFFLTQF